jgi:BASS family bile acid:Na+ symporter
MNLTKIFGYLSLISVLAIIIAVIADLSHLIGPLVILFFGSLALFFAKHAVLKSFAFTIWVFTFVAISLFYPSVFGTWFGFDLKFLIVPLIQIIMFGMGTTLSVQDFTRVFTMPWPVFIGMFLQYTVMPLVGFSLATAFGFAPEIAAGIVLIGSCPGGVASNLMAYLARGNVALSVTMTSCSTLVSPVMTPFLMKTLAGKMVPIDFVAMMLSILNMIIVPIVAGLIANRILYSKKDWANRISPLVISSLITIGLAIMVFFIDREAMGPLASLKDGLIIGFALIGVVSTAKLIISVILKGPENWMDKALPIVSMAGICYIIAIITARSSEQLMTVGIALVFVAIIHNAVGYLSGYWLARLVRLDENTARTISFEVGMQNGGMASGLAISVLKSTSTALAPAIFGPWMNVSGSVLANWWHRKPPKDKNKDNEQVV